MAARRDYDYLVPGYKFPVSNIECIGYHYERRDAPTIAKPNGYLRHYVMVKCPFCGVEFEGRLDRLEFNPAKQSGPRTLCCKKCSNTHKRPFKDPWRSSKNNNAEKIGINITRTEDLEGRVIGKLTVGPAKDGYTDKFGLAWWPCKCACDNFEFVRGNALTSGATKIACKRCLGSMPSGERLVADWLKDNNLQYETQVTFNDLKGIGNGLLRFDFGVKNINNEFVCLIEFQGKEHYEVVDFFGGKAGFEAREEHDNRKRQWCKEHNIKLIEIPYNYKNLDDYLNEVKQ